MVFVTVGNAKLGFRRLLDTVNELAGTGPLRGESVVIQFGHNHDFCSNCCKCIPFIAMDEFARYLEKAELIISHGGCTVLSAVKVGKIPVVMPRRKKYGEHINDHQLQLVEALAAEGAIVPAYEPGDLPQAIAEARSRKVRPAIPHSSRMLELVGQAIHELTVSQLPSS